MTAPGSASEAQILLTACSVEPMDLRARRLRTLLREQSPDWNLLLHMAAENRVLLPLHEAFSAAGLDGVPEPVRAQLEKTASRIKLRNLGMLRELLEVVRLLEARGISPIPLKGPLLAHELYGDVTRRQFVDLDLLVARDEVRPVVSLLEARGYRVASPSWSSRRERLLEEDCEMDLISSSTGTRLELHWELLPRRHAGVLRMDALRRGLRRLEMAGHAVSALSASDQFLYLCVHGGDKHLWARLRWLCDVARLLAGGERGWSWEEILERASAMRRVRSILLGAYLAWDLLEAPLSDALLERASRDPDVGARAGIVTGRLFRVPPRMPSYREWRSEIEAADRKLDGRGLRPARRAGVARYLRTILTPEWTDRQALGVPRPLSFLYYVYRPLRLLKKHKARAFRHV